MEVDGVFEGGGVRGIALAGAAAAALDRGRLAAARQLQDQSVD